ncbi:PepSY domain-containing protein [Gallaecimonas sp. GXIMD4217]|uniref:PepSY domain-containing protein n=1 Tax=Gallaecimonas sp. GXIMD4217 TaxID=3131927 RepID=UPI00311ABF00
MAITSRLRQWHRYLALVVGIQLLLWLLSGLYMVLVPLDRVHGDHLVREATSKQAVTPLPPGAVDGELLELRLVQDPLGPLYLARTEQGWQRFDAVTLQALGRPDAKEIRRRAQALYAGEGNPELSLLPRHPRELGGRPGPVWRADFDGLFAPSLYFDADTGLLRAKRSDLWRAFDLLWMLHIMDYDTREEVNHPLLQLASLAALLFALAGLWLLARLWRQPLPRHRSWLPRLHRWLGLVAGIQLLLWSAGGLVFSLLPQAQVAGQGLIRHDDGQHRLRMPELGALLARFPGQDWRMTGGDHGGIVLASGERLRLDLKSAPLTEYQARDLARHHYRGELVELALETEATTANRKWPKPLWRLDFEDGNSLYLDAVTGAPQGVRTPQWTLFDLFWMLHTMDYLDRDDFNHPLIWLFALGTLVLALTGSWMLVRRLPLPGRRLAIRVGARQQRARAGTWLFEQLPELQDKGQCGGGGGCGGCVVRIEGDAPVSPEERARFSQKALDRGMRLACQQRLRGDIRLR